MNRNVHTSSDRIPLMVIGVTGREIPNPVKLSQKAISGAPGQPSHDFHNLQINEQAILHRLLRKLPLEVVEFYPMGGIGIIDLLCELLLEFIVSLRLQGDHVGDQFPTLLRRELIDLIL
jgi:hypothetical protein